MVGKLDPTYLHVFPCRHPSRTGWGISTTGNRMLLIGLAAELGLILLIAYTPAGNQLFATQAFEPQVWVLIVVLALGFGALEEARKYLVRRSDRQA